MSVNYARQRELFDGSQLGLAVHVIGVGSTGSLTVQALGKMGVRNIHIWDHDMVESQNVPVQLYRLSDVGTPKVEALAAYAEREELDTVITLHAEFVTATTELEGIVVSCVDSMTSRQGIWEALRYNALVPLYLDGRVGGDLVNLHIIHPSQPEEVKEYEEFYLSYLDNQVLMRPCGAESIIYTATQLATFVAKALALHQHGKLLESSIRANLEEFTVRTSSMLVN